MVGIIMIAALHLVVGRRWLYIRYAFCKSVDNISQHVSLVAVAAASAYNAGSLPETNSTGGLL